MTKHTLYQHLFAQKVLLTLIYLKWLDDLLSSTPGYSSNTNSKGSGVSTATQQQKEYYTYDAAGNRRSSDKDSIYTYNSANQLTTNGGTYSYDRNGNLTSKTDGTTSWTYSYDYENRLTKVNKTESGTTTTSEYKYDLFGRRIEKKITENNSTATTKYVYDNEDIILEYDENRIIGNSYIHGPGIDEPLAVTTNQGTYYYHADGLGSIVALTDTNGKTQQTYEYDSFGNLKDQKNKIKQPYTYTGREWDREAGLYYYRARYYDPKVGRFVSFDPILHPANGAPRKSCSQIISYPTFEDLKENPQKLNPFVYTENNAVNFTDPSGLGPCEDAAMPCFSAASDRLFQCRKNVFQLAVACTTGCIPLCLASGPAFGQCFIVCEAGCTAGAGAGFTACSAIAAAERIQCALQYRRCKKDRCEPLLPFSLE